MSHDRGCYCGREPYEYKDCERPTCHRRDNDRADKATSPRQPLPTVKLYNGPRKVCEALVRRTCRNGAHYIIGSKHYCVRHAEGEALSILLGKR